MKGSCNCGAIRFSVAPGHERAVACHCTQCRKQSGHVWASGLAPLNQISITGDVTWYRSSVEARRGFCPTCGCFLFWQAHDEGTISFALGAVDGPTGLTLQEHIFVADKGDYYDITDELPQKD